MKKVVHLFGTFFRENKKKFSVIKKIFHCMSIALKSHVNFLGRKPLEYFWDVFLFKMGPSKTFCMFLSKFVVLKQNLGFSTFVVSEIFWVKTWKILKLWPFPQTLFLTTKNFSLEKKGLWEKAKISKFFNFWPKIFQKQQMLKTLKMFFRTTNLLENMQKNFGGPILNKNTSQKNSRGKRPLFPQRVNVRFKSDWHKMTQNFCYGSAVIFSFTSKCINYTKR